MSLQGRALNQTRLCFIDFEATGTKSETARIIEAAYVIIEKYDAESLDFKLVKYYSSFIHPGIDIPEIITEITGITNKMVVGAQTIAEFISDHIKEIYDGRTLVFAHNAKYDRSLLRNEARRNSQEVDLPDGYHMMDTVTFAQRIATKDLKNQKLQTLLPYYKIESTIEGIESSGDAHRAIDDVCGLTNLFTKVLFPGNYSFLRTFANNPKSPISVDQFVKYYSTPMELAIFPYGKKWGGKKISSMSLDTVNFFLGESYVQGDVRLSLENRKEAMLPNN